MTRRTSYLPALLAAGVLLVVCAAALLLAAPAQRAGAAFPGDNGRIAFVAGRDGGPPGIYAMRPDGSDARQLAGDVTPRKAYVGSERVSPEYSPDGSKVVFSRSDGHDAEVFVKDLASGDVAQLTDNHSHADPTAPGRDNPIDDYDPAWSPDGSKIAFARYQMDDASDGYNNYALWVMDADGTDKRRLTDTPEVESSPQWSPDGGEIAFVRADTADPQSAGDVWTMGADGSGQQNVTGTPQDDEGSPDWGPQCPCPAPPQPDTTAPAVTGPRPAPGAEVRGRTPTVGATVRDAGGELKAPDIGLRIDGARRSFSYDPDTGRLTRETGRLAYGRHRAEVTATDPLGNSATRSWTFRVVRGP